MHLRCPSGNSFSLFSTSTVILLPQIPSCSQRDNLKTKAGGSHHFGSVNHQAWKCFPLELDDKPTLLFLSFYHFLSLALKSSRQDDSCSIFIFYFNLKILIYYFLPPTPSNSSYDLHLTQICGFFLLLCVNM